MIFMTSNLGAAEMSALMTPRMGFATAAAGEPRREGNEKLNQKLSRSGVEAARRRFTPEFMNRLDKIVVFKPLGASELRRILDIELGGVQQRIGGSRPFVFTVTDEGKQFLLDEGYDLKYGARHLKRAIERLVVHPISNLIASDQIRSGDWIKVDHLAGAAEMTFSRTAEGLPVQEMAQFYDALLTSEASAGGSRWSVSRVQPIRPSRRA